MKRKKIFYEHDEYTGISIGLEYEKYLYHCQSKYQKIEVIKTSHYGNAMYLDGCFMLAEKNIDFYHDKCLSLVPKNTKNILIIGGGDFALASTLTNNTKIRSVDIVEIDRKVIEVSKRYFSKYFKFPRNKRKIHNLIIEDGMKYVKESNKIYDCIIIDSTDPIGQAKVLVSKIFIKKCYEHLSKTGLVIHQSGSPVKDMNKIIRPLCKKYKEVGFKNIKSHYFSMPLYPTGTWSFMTAERA